MPFLNGKKNDGDIFKSVKSVVKSLGYPSAGRPQCPAKNRRFASRGKRLEAWGEILDLNIWMYGYWILKQTKSICYRTSTQSHLNPFDTRLDPMTMRHRLFKRPFGTFQVCPSIKPTDRKLPQMETRQGVCSKQKGCSQQKWRLDSGK